MVRLNEIIFEFRRVGAYVKVSAVDPVTTVEVAIVGDPSAGQQLLQEIAAQKLRYVLARQSPRSRRPQQTPSFADRLTR